MKPSIQWTKSRIHAAWLICLVTLSTSTGITFAQDAQEALPEAIRRLTPLPAPPKSVPKPFTDNLPSWLPEEVIAWVGQANGVREQQAGDLESVLTWKLAASRPRFRWFSWEGDTVYEQWRDLNFGSWAQQMGPLGVTTVIVQLGQMEALEGPERVAEFEAAYHALLASFESVTRRWILITPTPFENPDHPAAPQLADRNSDLELYVESIRRIADARKAVFLDVFNPMRSVSEAGTRITDNGMHLNDSGRRILNELIASKLISAEAIEDASGTGRANGGMPESLKELVREKNRLWFDLWRPMNWAFVYGDRTEQLFGQPGASGLYLKQELEFFQPLLADIEDRIHAVARGESEPLRSKVSRPNAANADGDAAEVPPKATEDPIITERSFTPHPRLVVERVATEQDGVINPIHMAWDGDGQLWVTCSPTYPHIQPGQAPGDYILVGSDTNGDGKLDSWKRFAEGLMMVQGVEPGDGGVYVCEGTELTHWRDTDGDGRGDVRRVILAGFGTGDTHQLLNSVTRGPDGSFWMTQGHHVYSRVETPWGVSRLDKAGVWRYWPKRAHLEGYFQMSTAGANCWGVAFDEAGEIFHKTGDRPEGYYSVPGLIGGAPPMEYHGVGSLFGQARKTTALEILGHPHWGDWKGGAVLAGFMGHDVVMHRITEDGSGFNSEPVATWLTSTAEAFRPVGVREGPDGALYVADFHNPIIGHYQHSYRDPRRDNRHGRIWRIRPQGTESSGQLHPGLGSKSVPECLAALESPNRWVRDQARRRLFEAATPTVQAALTIWVAAAGIEVEGTSDVRPAEDVNASTDANSGANSNANPVSFPGVTPRENRIREGIQILAAHEVVEESWLASLMTSSNPGLRAFTVRKVGELAGGRARMATDDFRSRATEWIRAALADAHPRVRLSAVIACGAMESAEAVAMATSVIEHPMDRFLTYALRQLIRARVNLLGTVALDTLDWGSDPARQAFVRETVKIPEKEPDGLVLYRQFCGNCHQPGGGGLPGIYPPLRGTDWIKGDPDVLIRMVLHGVQGPMRVGDRVYNLPMPPSGFTDRQVADVLTYVRSAWENVADPVEESDVARVRSLHADRRTPWIAEGLRLKD